jgi:hypothetical protein
VGFKKELMVAERNSHYEYLCLKVESDKEEKRKIGVEMIRFDTLHEKRKNEKNEESEKVKHAIKAIFAYFAFSFLALYVTQNSPTLMTQFNRLLYHQSLNWGGGEKGGKKETR